MDDAKRCTGCGKTKKLDEFSPKRGGKLGRHAQCKPCRSIARVSARAADPERVRAVDRKADLKRGPSTPRVVKWRQDNPEAHTLRSRQDRSKRRAAERAGGTAPVDFAALYAAFSDCYLCGQQLAGDTDMDHVVPLSRGGAHCPANLRPTHEPCNLRKSNKLLTELDWYAGPVDIGVSVCHDGATTTDEGTI